MELVDILARELKEWPEDGGCGYCCQSDSTTEVYFGSPAKPIFLSQRASRTAGVRVFRDEWEAAVRALPWDKGGLPPVGLLCEMQNAVGVWREVEIFAHFKGNVFGWDGGELVNYISSDPREFRPIRTPEQIAAEQRSKAIDAMCKDSGYDGGGATFYTCAGLYDAGYRKS